MAAPAQPTVQTGVTRHAREMLVVGPCAWNELGLSPSDWPDCRVTELAREADALAHLARRAVDVVVTSPSASVGRVTNIAKEARRLQPGVRVIVLAAQLTPEDIINALRSHVYACFALPVPADELRASIRQALVDDQPHSGIQVQSAVPHWVALRVACRRVNAERLAQFMKLITAFREVLLNAMEHGAGFDPEKVVEVAAVRTERTLVYYFKDPGPGFDVRAPKMVASEDDPITHLAEREAEGKRAGGFGLLLASKLVDEVHFNESGNEVILVKHVD
jgi:anti-sigma regulatory factor (Ser/Thr protein kinase)/CheY-like chemotaxis protein